MFDSAANKNYFVKGNINFEKQPQNGSSPYVLNKLE